MTEQKEEKISLHIELLEQMQSLMTAGFALVAALAWNTAIQDLFARIFPDQNSLIAKFLYAVFITILVVAVTHRIGKAISLLKLTMKK